MAGSVFDPEEDPEEQANGAGFAALLRALPAATTDDPDRTGQVNLPNGGAIDKTDGLMPWEAGPDSKAGLSSDDERGRDDHQPSSYMDMANAAAPSSTDVDNAAQYGRDGIPTKAPTLPTPPTYTDTAADQAAIAAHQGKWNPAQYKASGWRRALAGIAGGMVAAGSRDPAAGWRVGEGVLNAPLERGRAQFEAEAAPLQTKLAADQARNQQLRQQYGDQVSQYGLQERDQINQARIVDWKAQADQRKADAQKKLEQIDPKTMKRVDPNNPYGEYQGTNYKGETVRGLPPPDVVQKSNSYQQYMRQQDLKEMMKNGIRLSPDEAKYYVVNGKLAEPKANTTLRIPSAESEKYNDWKKQFQVDNGRPPNNAEIAAFGHAGKGTGGFTKSLGDRIEANKGAGFIKAQANFKALGGAANAGNALGYQADLQAVQNEYEQRLEDATGQEIPHVDIKVDKDGNVNWGSAQQAATPAAAAPAPTSGPSQASATAPPAAAPVAQPAQQTGAADAGYQKWLQTNRLNESPDYDTYAAYKAGVRPSSNGHLSDEYKKPTHPTYSDESQSSRQPGAPPAGHWTDTGGGKWTFKASQTNVTNAGGEAGLKSYFDKREPGNTLVLPGGESYVGKNQGQGQQQAPQTVKVQSGVTVKVGGPITWHGKTGTVTAINPQTGKPKVKWDGAQ